MRSDRPVGDNERLGPYQRLEPLGQGGGGVVFRALSSSTGQTVALKTLTAPTADLLAGIRREVHALARLRHPGIVQILEHGIKDGVPWYAMELVEGLNLRRYWIGRRLVEILAVMRRLCVTLAYLHGEGLVHGDLKPENVLVRAGGSPVLVDFGLQSQFGGGPSREDLKSAGTRAGTLAYMAPEQIRGELVDARADLYSLGCMLYEVFVGHPPFQGTSAQEVLRQHLEAEPRALLDLAPGLAPAELEEVVMRLLAKQPQDRPGHATDVAAVLSRIADDGALAWDAPPPRAYLYRARLAGREGPMGVLQRALEALDRRIGGVVLLGGESGIGKTRMALELAAQAERRGVRVVASDCGPLSSTESGGRLQAAPLQPLRRVLQAIADRCREKGHDEAKWLLGRRAPVLAIYEPQLAAISGMERQGELAELPPDAARARLYSCLAQTLILFAQQRPLLLLLDDLQWADELSFGFLEMLLSSRVLDRNGLLVVATYRTEELEAPLRPIVEASEAHKVLLGRLDQEAVGGMVGDMLAVTRIPELFIRSLAEQSEGNPFFVAEYLRAGVQVGLIDRDEDGRWRLAGTTEPGEELRRIPLPNTLRELVVRRLAALGDAAQSIVQAAAVMGRDLDARLLARVAGTDEDGLLEPLRELLVRQVLEQGGSVKLRESAGSGPVRIEALRFVHDKIREVAYEQIDEARRVELHRAVAEASEELLGTDGSEMGSEVGLHWERAGVTPRAIRAYLAAGRSALARRARGEGERLLRSVLRLATMATPESVAARNELGRNVLAVQGRNAEALAALVRGLEDARSLGDSVGECTSLYGLVRVYRNTGRLAEAQRAAESALEILRCTGDRRWEGLMLNSLAVLHYDQGRTEEAGALYEQALALHREVGNRRYEGVTLGNLGIYLAERGDFASARLAYEEALVVHREVGNRGSEGVTLTNLANLDLSEGLEDQARAYLEEALRIHRELGNPRDEELGLLNLGRLHLRQGRWDEAQTVFQHALDLAREIGELRMEGVAHIAIARLLRLTTGELDESERRVAEAEALLKRVGDTLYVVQCTIERGFLALARGRSGRAALEAARQALGAAAGDLVTEVSQALASLERAVEAFENDIPLFRGEREEDVSEALRRALVKTKQAP